jgi:hypothetical protein
VLLMTLLLSSGYHVVDSESIAGPATPA